MSSSSGTWCMFAIVSTIELFGRHVPQAASAAEPMAPCKLAKLKLLLHLCE